MVFRDRIRNSIKALTEYFDRHYYQQAALDAMFVILVIETVSRRSLVKALSFMVSSPLVFVCNALIVFFTLCLSLLFASRHSFAKNMIMGAWLIMGIVNGVVLHFRMTPFTAEDFSMIPSLMRIAKNYTTIGTYVLLAAAAALLVVLIVLLWRWQRRSQVRGRWFWTAARMGAVALGLYAVLHVGLETQALSQDFMNLADAYEEYGFAYCFSTSIVDVGIDQPDDYSPETIASIAQQMTGAGDTAAAVQDDGAQTGEATQTVQNIQTSVLLQDESDAEVIAQKITDPDESAGSVICALAAAEVADSTENRTEDGPDAASGETETVSETAGSTPSQTTPNFIFIQLESFFDPSYAYAWTFSENPIPVFTSLKESCAGGFLTVPVVGAGTVNTEFEILTGMTTDYFGAGEYPYNTVLKETTVESLAHILKKSGYTATAVHNNTGTFYNRDLVFSQMGFDRFVPAEYMYGLKLTPNNWAKDDVLPGVILDTLQQSESADLIYTITVQSHGRYPDSQVLENPEITAACDDININVYPFEYYVNQIHEVDEMIGELLGKLEERGEPTVVVMYGDHLPALGLTGEDLLQPSLYQTEYVIWNNFGMTFEGGDREAETLADYVLSCFGLDQGIMPDFHRTYDGTEAYDQVLEELEYDMLYGEGYIFSAYADSLTLTEDEQGRVRGYTASDIEFGLRTICVTGWEERDGEFCVTGANFNESSRIVIDTVSMNTELIDEQTLRLDGKISDTWQELYVGQFDENLSQLGEGTNTLRHTTA